MIFSKTHLRVLINGCCIPISKEGVCESLYVGEEGLVVFHVWHKLMMKVSYLKEEDVECKIGGLTKDNPNLLACAAFADYLENIEQSDLRDKALTFYLYKKLII